MSDPTTPAPAPNGATPPAPPCPAAKLEPLHKYEAIIVFANDKGAPVLVEARGFVAAAIKVAALVSDQTAKVKAVQIRQLNESPIILARTLPPNLPKG